MTFPIRLTYNENIYTSFLTKVTGAGDSDMFHLMIDNYYHGRLIYSGFEKRWVFDSSKEKTNIDFLFPKHVTDLANQGKLFNS